MRNLKTIDRQDSSHSSSDNRRFNALTHNLSGRNVVLCTEERRVYARLRAAYVARFAPADQVELDIVDDMVAARWQLRRIEDMEVSLLDIQINSQRRSFDIKHPGKSEEIRTALGFYGLAEDNETLNLLLRYRARFERILHNSLRDLKILKGGTLPPSPGFLDTDDQPESEQNQPSGSELRNEPADHIEVPELRGELLILPGMKPKIMRAQT